MATDYIHLKHSLDTLREELIQIPFVSEASWSPEPPSVDSKDLLITRIELNHTHGFGVLLGRIFDHKTCINLKSTDHFLDSGKGPFQSCRIDVTDKLRSDIFLSVINILSKERIKRIICSPFQEDEYLIGIAAKCIFNVPMVVWVMDDYLTVNAQLASELFSLADIRFVISPEMRDFYEKKFRQKFYVLPPTVDVSSIKRSCQTNTSYSFAEKTCVMIGNIFIRSLLEDFMRLVKKSGWTVHWYGHGSGSRPISSEELRAHGIIKKGFLPEKELQGLAAVYPFAIATTGSGKQDDPSPGVTFYSLSSRIIFLLATTHIPILVVGNEKSCIANFVRNFGVGLSIDYDEEQFAAAIKKLSDREFLAKCSQNAAINAAAFSDEGMEEWIWKSCESRRAIDERFEKLFRRQLGTPMLYREDPILQNLHEGLQATYYSLNRLAKRTYQPDFVIDVGASFGVWSETAQGVFPKARFILVEPLSDRYTQWYHQQYPQFEWVLAAASNAIGKANFQVSHDLVGSSLLHPKDHRTYESIEVTATTLDTVLAEKVIWGRGILKIDVQYAEHLVLEGAAALLKQVDVVILELTLRSGPPGSKTLIEMIHLMEALGFHYFDDVGEWRCPIDGTLQQKDILFMRQEMIERFES